MLKSLKIQNYALIQDLTLEFDNGFLIITGETGAGKSILLGALGMILGNRADIKSIVNQEEKCVAEATFNFKNYPLQNFFEENDLDFEEETIVRREITPSGKSRAFINDTPVLLDVLQSLGKYLIDIHSQHDTSEIIQKSFQLDLIDAVAGQMSERNQYQVDFQNYIKLKKQIAQDEKSLQELRNSQDYNSFLLDELMQLQLQSGEQEVLESELEVLENSEEIRNNLTKAAQISTADEIGLQALFTQVKFSLKSIALYDRKLEELFQRIDSVSIELKDVIDEILQFQDKVEHNPYRIEEINDRLQSIYSLQKKHQVSTIQELLKIQTELGNKAADFSILEEKIAQNQALLLKSEENLNKKAETLHKNRVQAAPDLTQEIETILSKLGMNEAQLQVQIIENQTLTLVGKDEVELLMSANKGRDFQSLAKAASGGERSRLMLAIKKIMAENQQLPTLILDEIDTGVSGKVANQVGAVMHEMANTMQMISVTHLPQIAAQGNQHFKVYKTEIEGVTQTFVKELSTEERIKEIAQMISGSEISQAAEQQAKELLGLN